MLASLSNLKNTFPFIADPLLNLFSWYSMAPYSFHFKIQPTTNSVWPLNYVSKRYIEIKEHVGMMDVTMKCQKSTVTFIFFLILN